MMIRFSLQCSKDHQFDSWFKSGVAYDALAQAGQLMCPICGDASVEKSLMTPAVRPAEKSGTKPLTSPQNDLEAAMAEMRRAVEENSEYVGLNFAAEARRMHDGEIDPRAIYGEAKLTEAKALIDDGVPVAPLPFIPHRKAN
jgi:hypothetical protein